jgi:uncharacterized protein YnzC (UPF0291/DUF896 family)
MYYFNVRNGGIYTPDGEGSAHNSLSSALLEVREMARDMAIDDLRQGVRISDSVIEITDSDGSDVGSMRVRDILEGPVA